MPYCSLSNPSLNSFPTINLRLAFIPIQLSPSEYAYIDNSTNRAYFYFDCNSDSDYEITVGMQVLRKFQFVFNYANSSMGIMIPLFQTKANNYTFKLTPQHQYYPYYMLSQAVTIGSNSQQITINFDQMIFSLSYIPTSSCTKCNNAVYICSPNDTTCKIESPYSFTLQNNLFSGEGLYTYDELQINSSTVPLIFLSVNSVDTSNIPTSLIIEGSFVHVLFRMFLQNLFQATLGL
jgi:hypothetical protein